MGHLTKLRHIMHLPIIDMTPVVGAIDAKGIIILLAIGAVVGWLAEMITKNSMGLIGNIIVGILGCVFGGWLLGGLIELGNPLVSQIATGTVGAVILLVILSFIAKAK